MRSFISLFIIFSLILTGCSATGPNLSAALEDSHAQIVKLQEENEQLRKEIEELKNGPEKLLARAKQYFENKDLESISSTMETLADKHPEAQEIQLVQEMINTLTIEKEKAEAEQKKKAEKEAAEKKKRIAAATQKMRSNRDEVNGITWYRDKTTTQYVNAKSFHIYFGKYDDNTVISPRLKIQYFGDQWVYVDKYIIKVDDEKFELYPGSDIKRDNDTKVWEYYDTNMGTKDWEMVKKIISSKKTTVRHQGQYYYDHVVTDKEKKALQNTLDAYEALGGEIPTG